MNKLLIAAALLLASTAANASSVEVVPTGPNQYLAEATGMIAGSSASPLLIKLYKQANKVCSDQRMQLKTLNKKEKEGVDVQPSAELWFECTAA